MFCSVTAQGHSMPALGEPLNYAIPLQQYLPRVIDAVVELI